jgi:hypothetical protein
VALTGKQKARITVAAIAVQGAIAALTLRDLSHRSSDRVRGPKALWRVVGTANTAGSAAYWIFGRK